MSGEPPVAGGEGWARKPTQLPDELKQVRTLLREAADYLDTAEAEALKGRQLVSQDWGRRASHCVLLANGLLALRSKSRFRVSDARMFYDL